MSSWVTRANRALSLFEGSTDDAGDRTWQIFNHVLYRSNDDSYISKDFAYVQEMPAALPPGMEFFDVLRRISGHVRLELETAAFDDTLSDQDFRMAALSFDRSIRRHIRFLDDVVHHASPGAVHLKLWAYILGSRERPASIYSIYKDYLVEA